MNCNGGWELGEFLSARLISKTRPKTHAERSPPIDAQLLRSWYAY